MYFLVITTLGGTETSKTWRDLCLRGVHTSQSVEDPRPKISRNLWTLGAS